MSNIVRLLPISSVFSAALVRCFTIVVKPFLVPDFPFITGTYNINS